MRRAKKESKKGESSRALPWAIVLQTLVVVGRRLGSLSSRDRARLLELL